MYQVNEPEMPTFVNGEQIYLAKGPYQGMVGTFLALAPDRTWGEIRQVNTRVQNHPLIWMQRCPEGDLVWSELLRPQLGSVKAE